MRLDALKKAYIGWCQRYKLKLMRPMSTNGRNERNFPIIVCESENIIIKAAPRVGSKRAKLWPEVESRVKKEIIIIIKPNPDKIFLERRGIE